MNHYRCLRFYIPATHRFHLSDTWRLYPTHCQIPTTTEIDNTLSAAATILNHLGHAIPTTAATKLQHIRAISNSRQF
jgi:hypothetical protein